MNLHDALREEFMYPLPGWPYQRKLAPETRQQFNRDETGVTDAAVSILLLDPVPEIVLIRRAEYEGHHSNQVSFPGGKKDVSDASLLHTSIRETYEEIGVRPEPTEYAGELTPLDIPVSNYRVFPFVFHLQREVDFKPDPAEVRYIIRFPARDLLDDSLIKMVTPKADSSWFKDIPYYDLANEFVWGATSMILSEFAEILKRIHKKNPGLL